jgi:hypothetical protein
MRTVSAKNFRRAAAGFRRLPFKHLINAIRALAEKDKSMPSEKFPEGVRAS